MLALDNKVMRFFKIFFVALVAAVAMTGCDSPEYPDPAGERGTLSFDGFVLTAVDKTLASPVEIDVADFVVNVRNSSTGDVVASWTYGEIPASVELLDGSYVVEAYNAELQPAAWDAPYYYASAQVRVYGKEETSGSTRKDALKLLNPFGCGKSILSGPSAGITVSLRHTLRKKPFGQPRNY